MFFLTCSIFLRAIVTLNIYVNENTIVEWLGLCAVAHSGEWKLTVVNFNLEKFSRVAK